MVSSEILGEKCGFANYPIVTYLSKRIQEFLVENVLYILYMFYIYIIHVVSGGLNVKPDF